VLRRVGMCALACAVLAGCGGGGGATAPETTTGSPSGAGATATTAPPPATAPPGTTPARPPDQEPGPAARTTALTLDGQPALVVEPERPTGDLLLYVHGAGEDAQSSLSADDPKAPLFAALLERGYAIAASDAHGDAWGDPASVDDYVRLAGRLAQQGYGRVTLLAQSMGGLASLQLVDRLDPVAWAGIYPVCNLAAMVDLGRFTPAIRAAWGEGEGWRPTTLSPAVPERAEGLPMGFWASAADTVVPKATNTDLCAADAQARGALVTVTPTTGDHGDLASFDTTGLLEFLERASRTSAAAR
jgi:pimeloyl-ACP methyl ester carboxylesterase